MKNADKYFDNLDAVEEMCYQTKKRRGKISAGSRSRKRDIEERCFLSFLGPKNTILNCILPS